MPNHSVINPIPRRNLLRAGLVVAAAQVASPFVWRARAADSVKIGVDNTLTGTYAALGKNEQVGIQLAVDQINAKGGILGRHVDLSVEDSTSGDAGTAVQKARKLIDGDKVDFLLGNVNSALVARDRPGFQREENPARGSRRAYGRGDGRLLPLERLPRLQHDADRGVRGRERPDQGLRQEILLHHAGLRLRTQLGSRHDQGLRRARRHPRGRRLDAARHGGFFVVSHQGAGGEPRRHPVPAGRRRHGERAEAGRAVRTRTQGPPGRRAAGNGEPCGACRPRRGSGPG